MRFGFTVPNNFGVADPERVVALGVRAEELGFDSVWVNHHVLNVGYVAERLGDKPYYDALTTLTWIAANTQRVRLGTSVLVLPYLHPMNLAKSVATLDRLSGGRVVLGVGVGSLPAENAALGVGYDGRGRSTDEAIDVMRGLWTARPFSFTGEHFRFDEVVASPGPAQPRLPVVIGGNGAPALRRVAARGDGWHPLGVSPDGARKRLAALDGELANVGRTRDEIDVSVRLDIARVTDGDVVAAYAAAGVHELVVSTTTADPDEVSAAIEALARWAW
jgi:probable F420-dependent oxidoreductase